MCESIMNSFDNLPLSDRQEQLEELSFRAFQNILPIGKFRFRDERGKDKGVDASIELLEGYANTNFRAQLQLKGTDSVNENEDGSIPRSVSVRNLNYLLNVPSALYILYVQPTNELRYVWARDEQRRLDSTNIEWEKQKTVTLLFNNVLNTEAFAVIFERIHREARLSRNVHGDIARPLQGILGLGDADGNAIELDEFFSVPIWQLAVKNDSNNALAWQNLAQSYYQEEELSKAYGAISRAWEIGPHDNDMKAIRACIIAEYGEAYGGPIALNYEAIELFESLRSYTNVEGYSDYNIGNCYRHLGKIEQAIKYFKKALSFNPEHDLATCILNNLGSIYDSMGMTREAIAVYKKAIRLDPMHWQSLAGLASIEAGRERYDKAVEYLKLCLKANRSLEYSGVPQLSVLSRSLFEIGEYEEAFLYAEKTLSINPSDEFTRRVKINILSQLWRKNPHYIEVALKYFRDEIINNFSPAVARYELFFLYLEKDEQEKAKAIIEESIKKDEPAFGTYYNYGRLLRLENDFDNALKYFSLAYEMEKTHAVVHQLGDCLYASGKYLDAIIFYKLALIDIKNPGYLLYHIASCYSYLRDYLSVIEFCVKSICYSPPCKNNIWGLLIHAYYRFGDNCSSDLIDLSEEITYYEDKIEPILERLISIMEKAFGKEFAERIASCELCDKQKLEQISFSIIREMQMPNHHIQKNVNEIVA